MLSMLSVLKHANATGAPGTGFTGCINTIAKACPFPDLNSFNFVSTLEEAYRTNVDISTRIMLWRAAGSHFHSKRMQHAVRRPKKKKKKGWLWILG